MPIYENVFFLGLHILDLFFFRRVVRFNYLVMYFHNDASFSESQNTVTVRKRKPITDEKDREIIQRLSGRQSHWSTEEDRFLMLCRVASLFLDPTSKLFVVNCFSVRDLLLESYPDKSTDKTSSACRRRFVNLMANSSNVNTVSVSLEDAKLDKYLVNEFCGEKPKKTDKVAWKMLLNAVMKRLLVKFEIGVADRGGNVTLPDAIEVFNNTFKITSPVDSSQQKTHHDPTCEDEVKHATLCSLIVSATAIMKPGNKWSHLLRKLYQLYPENMLESAVSHLRRETIVISKIKNKKKLLRSHLSKLPYQFSRAYENALKANFPISHLTASEDLLAALSKLNDYKGIELKDDVDPVCAVAVLALASLNELQLTVQLPNKVISFDSSSNVDDPSAIIWNISSPNNKNPPKISSLLQEWDSDPSENQNAPDTSENGKQSMCLYGLFKKLFESDEPVQPSKDCVVLNPCKIFCNLESNVNIQSLPSTSRDLKLSNVTKELKEPRTKVLVDICIPEIKKSLTASIPSEAFAEERNLHDSLKETYPTREYTAETINDAKSIFKEILDAGVAGITEKSIWRKFRVLNGELSLFQHLHFLREAALVIRAGVASFVYVCICYAKCWVLTSFVTETDLKRELMECGENSPKSVTKSDVNLPKEVHFLPRAWRYPDGDLNKTILKELLQTVLSYIVSYPGVSTSLVTEHFNVLQPVQILELLEVLENANCIRKYYAKIKPKGKLFSKFTPISIEENPDYLDYLDHLESLPTAGRNFDFLQKVIMDI